MSENQTDIDRLRMAPKEVFYVCSVLAGFFMQYYTLKSEIHEAILSQTTDKKITDMRFATLEASVFDLNTDSKDHENRLTSLEAILPNNITTRKHEDD